ncbi:MAG: TauD/TfdA dioxygenase family protein [Rhodospirillales bacterium]|jgi:taurine dioxygenase
MASSKPEFIPLSDNIGVEAHGVDVKNMDDATFKAIYQAWLDHSGVLLIRGQELDCPAILEFSERFGEIDMPRKTRIDHDPWIPQYPQFIRITDLKHENGDVMGALGNGEAHWHADMTYLEDVPRASILYACEVPDSGGDTGFLSMYNAIVTMPAELRKKIEGKIQLHDHVHNAAGWATPNWDEQTDPRDTPGARHPMIIKHPETGREALLIGRRPYAYIHDYELDESEAILNEVWAHATQEKFSWHHQWAPGDIIIWDNFAALHHRTPFEDTKRRVMLRTQIKGPHPIAA